MHLITALSRLQQFSISTLLSLTENSLEIRFLLIYLSFLGHSSIFLEVCEAGWALIREWAVITENTVFYCKIGTKMATILKQAAILKIGFRAELLRS